MNKKLAAALGGLIVYAGAKGLFSFGEEDVAFSATDALVIVGSMLLVRLALWEPKARAQDKATRPPST